MDKRFQISFVAEIDGELLREAISRQNISKKGLTQIKFHGGLILVNGKEENVRFPLQKNDIVQIFFPLEQLSEGLFVENGPLDIIYEDEALLIVNKPPNISTIPSREHPNGTIANFICGYFKEKGIASTVHVVTRLDKDTSGLVCIAKHSHVHHVMSQMLKNKEIEKRYEAVVHGHVKVDEISIKAPIGRAETSIIERIVTPDGQFAYTDVVVKKRFFIQGEPFTHVGLLLHTGRTHQIRVHMAHIGHPLAGDDLYGGKRNYIKRQALHCSKLTFPHPLTNKQMHFQSVLPEDIQKLLDIKDMS